MSKDKITKYLLGIALVGIWGTLFFRIYQAVGAEEEISPSTQVVIPFQKTEKEERFTLLLDYNDPFGQKKYSRTRATRPSIKQKIPKAPTAQKAPDKKIVFPKINYKGYIENKNQRKALLQIADKSMPLKEGSRHEGLYIDRIFKDSIWIRFGGEHRTFFRAF